ncbi:MAG: DUF72 domain-containing protein [Armatimonadota bacterium]
MTERTTRYLIGTSGWSYKHWMGRFYPVDLPREKWLEFYCQHFPTVEINSTFYRLPQERMVKGWFQRTPDGFRFAVKMSRHVTHLLRLRDCSDAVSNWWARVQHLRHKLSVTLVQLPPSLHADPPLLRDFLALLPTNIRTAVEFRHESWHSETVYQLLQEAGAALCIISHPTLPPHWVVTAPFVYVRMHGSAKRADSCYTAEELAEWAEHLLRLDPAVREVFVYFNNDFNAYAVTNAKQLSAMVQK